MHNTLIFDLDGTLSDPEEGIVKSANHALSQCGFDEQPASEIAKYIGPQIDNTFKILSGCEEPETINKLVELYRERYGAIGYKENTLFDGIKEVLVELAQYKLADGTPVKLGLCTSKRADFTAQILEMFGLSDTFAFVSCGDVGIEKWQQLEELKAQGVIDENAVMIGDRSVDITAAKKNGLYAAGVMWGFGDEAEFNPHNPDYLIYQVADLTKLVTEK